MVHTVSQAMTSQLRQIPIDYHPQCAVAFQACLTAKMTKRMRSGRPLFGFTHGGCIKTIPDLVFKG